MKTLRNFKISKYTVEGGIRALALEGDSIILLLDKAYDPTFPVSIKGVIRKITSINCDTDKIYEIEYNETLLTGASTYLRLEDIVDYSIVSELDVLRAEVYVVETTVLPLNQVATFGVGNQAFTVTRTDSEASGLSVFISTQPGVQTLNASYNSGLGEYALDATVIVFLETDVNGTILSTVEDVVAAINAIDYSLGKSMEAITEDGSGLAFIIEDTPLGNISPATRIGQTISYTSPSGPPRMFMLTNLSPITHVELTDNVEVPPLTQSAIEAALPDKAAFRATIGAASPETGTILPPLWRLIMRSGENAAGSYANNGKFRGLVLGDSLGVNITHLLQKTLGMGGSDFGILSDQYWPTPGTMGHNLGVTEANQYARVPNGLVCTLAFASSQFLHLAPKHPFYNVAVNYLSFPGAGKLQIQFRPGTTGSWTNVTSAWSVRSGVNTGVNLAGGILDTANTISEQSGIAHIELPNGSNYYQIRIVPTEGSVRVSDVWFNNGALANFANTLVDNTKTGVLIVDNSVGGANLQSMKVIPAQAWAALSAGLDPHIITFRMDDTHTNVSYLQAHWLEYSSRILAAFPKAVLFVFGSTPSAAQPTTGDAQAAICDSYLREWCEENDQVFVDMRKMMPQYTQDGTLNDLWRDTLHTHDEWPRAVLMDILRPVINNWGSLGNQTGIRNIYRQAHENLNSIDLFDRNNAVQGSSAFERTLFLNMLPGQGGEVLFMNESSAFELGGQWVMSTVGFGATANDHPLGLALYYRLSRGVVHVLSGREGAGGVWGLNLTLASNLIDIGWSFIATRSYQYAVCAIGIAGQTAPILGARRQGSSNGTSAGNALWSWMDDGSAVYDGLNVDANRTTFTYAEPVASSVIHFPVNSVAGTGARPRVVATVPSYASDAAAVLIVSVGDTYYNEATGRVRTRLV